MVIETYLKKLSEVMINNNIKKPIFRGQINDKENNPRPIISSAARRLKKPLDKKDGSKDLLKQSRFIEYHNTLIEKAKNN